MKIITICGSLKFADEMKIWAEKLTLAGNCVLSVVEPTRALETYSAEEIAAFGAAHFQKIKLSDEIFVINKAGYIGQAVKKEIALAESLGKEISYLEK